MNISEPFIRRPVATSLLMAAIGFVGLVAFPFLPVAPLPQVDFPTITVSATLQGASAETMAASVAAPLERQFGQIPGVMQMTSASTLGATSIVIQFELNRNIDSAGQDIQAAITVAGKTLPQQMTTPPSYKKINPADSPILILAAQSDTLPIYIVNDYADNFLAQQISQVRGVAQVSIGGEQHPSIRVQVDPAKLASSGVTLEEVRSTLITSTTIAAKGAVNTDKITFTIAANDQITTPSRSTTSCSPTATAARSVSATSARPSPPHPTATSPAIRTTSRAILLVRLQAARCQRRRNRRPHQGGAAAPDSQHPPGDRR